MINIIVAMDQKRGIGKNNKLMWHIPEDMKRFRQLTTGHPIIMGRKTFESISRSLPNRTNIIITRDPLFRVEGTIIVHSLEEAIEKAKKSESGEEVFIIGGGQIYQQALPLTDKLYLTIVKGNFNADTFFPDYSAFTKEVFREDKEENGYRFRFLELMK